MKVDDSNHVVLDYALAELNFYHYHTNSAHKSVEEKLQLLIKTLENLPTTIRSRPASIATLSSLYDELGMYDQRDELMKHSSDGIATQVYLADLALSMNQFEEAVEMYQSILDRMDLNQEDELRLQCQAKRIKALSNIDAEQASKCLSSLDVNWDKILATKDGKTGDQLENLDIPRLSKSTIGTSGGLQNGRRVIGESRTM
jgi:tetratricopeptide (TPR) repeat protein